MNNNYHYLESGLDNVFVQGLTVSDDNSETVIVVPFVEQLHHCIGLLTLAKGFISGKELRFLRTELELSPEQLASITDIPIDTLIDFEKSSISIENHIYNLVGQLFLDKYGDSIDTDFASSLESIKAISQLRCDSTEAPTITLQVQDNGYRPVAA